MTALNVIRVRRRRHRLPVEPRFTIREPLLVFVGLLTLLLVWISFGPGWAVLVAALVAMLAGLQLWARRGSYAPQPTRHRYQAPDYENRVLRLGLLALVLGPLLVVIFSVPKERFQEWSAAATTPKPGDCDWMSPPLGDKHCHYEGSFTHIKDRQGDRVKVEWHRVYDY
jgi:hypothetical protein